MRSILHIDMDAFYASVEQRDNPAFRGKPLVVGADPKKGKGRGVVSAASYEARMFGIHSAMPISRAYRRCPKAVYVPVSMARYREVSVRIFDIFHHYTDMVESLSLDEAFLDVTGSYRLFGNAETIGRRVQERIWKEERLSASVGVGSNKFVAKVASDLEKPKGFVIVTPGNESKFLQGLPVERLWGSGLKTTRRLHQLGYYKIGDLSREIPTNLRAQMGKLGIHLWELANGRDNRPVRPAESQKSLGAETTFSSDTADFVVVHDTLLALAERVTQRLRDGHVYAKVLTLKYRDETFQTWSRSMVLPNKTDQASVVFRSALSLIERVPARKRNVRLLGLSASNLSHESLGQQLSLFNVKENQDDQLTRAVDSIRRRFGGQSIQPATLLEFRQT